MPLFLCHWCSAVTVVTYTSLVQRWPPWPHWDTMTLVTYSPTVAGRRKVGALCRQAWCGLAERNFWATDHKRPQFRPDQAMKGIPKRDPLRKLVLRGTADLWWETLPMGWDVTCGNFPGLSALTLLQWVIISSGYHWVSPRPLWVSDPVFWVPLSESFSLCGWMCAHFG